MAGKPWYNNGIKEIQVDITKGEQIPKGYVRGRKPLTTEQKKIISIIKQCINKLITNWY